jgi:hypothetical protein
VTFMRLSLFILWGAFTWSARAAGAPIGQSPTDLAPTHGYVYVNLPKNIGPLTYLFPNNIHASTVLQIRNVGDKKRYSLLPRADTGANAFGMWLPAGEYVLASWGDHEWGDYPSIKVEAGRITNLGSLIPILIGDDKFVMLPVRLAESADPVQSAVEEFKEHLTTPKILEWLPGVPPKPMTMSSPNSTLGLIADLLLQYERHVNKPPLNRQLLESASIDQFLALAKTGMPPLSDEPAIDTKSNLYFGAALGQVRVRSSEGAWSSLDTGTMEHISSVAWINGTLLAGSYNGVLRSSSDGGTHWTRLASVETSEAIVGINRAGGRWLIVTTHPTTTMQDVPSANALKIYLAEKDDLSDLAVVRRVVFDDKAAAGHWRGADARVAGDFYFVNGFSNLLRLDLRTLEWKTVTPQSEIHGLNVSSTTGAITTFRAMGAFSKVYVSYDHGDTWSKRNAPPYVIKDVYFDETGGGQAVRLRMGAFVGTLEMLSYDNSKDRWNKTQDAPGGCLDLLHDPSHRQIFCVTTGNSILINSGSDWRAEFIAE